MPPTPDPPAPEPRPDRTPVRGTAAMIAGMAPRRLPGEWLFCSAADPGRAAAAAPHALATFREAEGLSLLLPAERAAALGFPPGPVMACITLSLHSALDGVGLTAAVAGTLAAAGIPCNVVAAFHHDHLFVPLARAEEALARLSALAAAAAAPGAAGAAPLAAACGAGDSSVPGGGAAGDAGGGPATDGRAGARR